MHRSHRATRKWLKNHKSPDKVYNLILSLHLPNKIVVPVPFINAKLTLDTKAINDIYNIIIAL